MISSIWFHIFVCFYKSLQPISSSPTVTVSLSSLESVHLMCLSCLAEELWRPWCFVCVDIMLAPKDAQLKVKVSPSITAWHSKLSITRVYTVQYIFVCKWPNPCQNQKTQWHLTASRKRGNGQRVTERVGVGRGMKGRLTRGGLLLCQRVCYGGCTNISVTQYFSPVRVCCKPPSPITLPFCSTSPPLSPSYSLYPPPPPSHSSSITAAFPSDIDLGRVATAALKLNMPAALRKAQMRCGG